MSATQMITLAEELRRVRKDPPATVGEAIARYATALHHARQRGVDRPLLLVFGELLWLALRPEQEPAPDEIGGLLDQQWSERDRHLASMGSGEPISAREAARRRQPLDGADAQALEGALAATERERDVARARVAELETIVEHTSTLVREDERRACIAYADRTERMFLARAQSIADDTDRADGEAAADDEDRATAAAAGARAVARGLRKGAHRVL